MGEEEVNIEKRSDERATNGKTEEDIHDQMGGVEPEAHPKGLQLALLTLSLMFAVFIMALDTTILCMVDQLLIHKLQLLTS
jgi:hypothetical protein